MKFFLFAISLLPLALAQSPSATLGTSNPKSLQALGYNPAQASFYASAITQAPVASAYEALNAEGAIERINGATAQSDYNSLLAAAVASLPESLRAPATSFFLGLEALASTTTAVGAVAASSSSVQQSAPARSGTGLGTLVLASVPASLTAGSGMPAAATQAAPAGMTTTIIGTAPAAHSVTSGIAPGQTGMAVGAVMAVVAGLAVGL